MSLLAELPRFFGYYNMLFLLLAALRTLLLAASGCVIGFGIGFALALLQETRGRALLPLRVAAALYVQVFQRLPVLVTLFLVFYGLQLAGVDTVVFMVAILTICLVAGAYLTEVLRAGLASVPLAERQAAEAMNFSLAQTLRYVVAPQAWRVILPPTFTFFLSLVKDTALASQIGVVELTYAAQVLNNKGFSPVLSFGSILVIYFALSYPIARLGRRLEVRLALSRPASR